MTVQLVTRWDEAAHPHQSMAWARACLRLARPGAELVVLRAESGPSGLVMPLYFEGSMCCRSPDRYAGPMCWGSPIGVANALNESLDWLRARGIRGVVLRACPTQMAPPFRICGGRETLDRPTVVVPPAATPGRDVRRAIAKAAERYQVVMEDLDPTNYAEALVVAKEAGLEALVEKYAVLLGSGVKATIFVAHEDQRMVAFCICTQQGGVVEAEAGAVLPDHRGPASPLKLIDSVILAVAARGDVTWVNMGPGVSDEPDDGVLAYKLRLGGQLRPVIRGVFSL